jgi:hypothetical protein
MKGNYWANSDEGNLNSGSGITKREKLFRFCTSATCHQNIIGNARCGSTGNSLNEVTGCTCLRGKYFKNIGRNTHQNQSIRWW